MTPTSASKKLILSFGFIAVSAAYAIWSHTGGSAVAQTLPAQSAAAPTATAPTQTVAAQPAAQPARMMGQASAPMMRAGQYANGTYTGSAADAYYGTVQVKAVVKNGQLADVQFLQYPSDRQHSLELSSYATPILAQEAIQAQSAQVDIVSGATATSEAFMQSLASALTQAKG